jgi:hypothetical protein
MSRLRWEDLSQFTEDEEPPREAERRIHYEVPVMEFVPSQEAVDRDADDEANASDVDDAHIIREIEARRGIAPVRGRRRVYRRVLPRRRRPERGVRRGGGNALVVRRNLAPRLPTSRERWQRLVEFGTRAGWTDPSAMLEVRGMTGYAVVYSGWTGIPGPVITTTVPHGSQLLFRARRSSSFQLAYVTGESI